MDVMIWRLDSKNLSKVVGIKASGSLKFDYLREEDLTPNLVWSPEGDRLVFTVPEGNPSLVPEKAVWNFYIVNLDGSNLKKITNPTRQITNYNLSWGK